MITDIASYLRFFDAMHRRTVRDVAALPPEAESWRPATGEGENAWGIGQLVGHIAGARLYFARAYRDEGWIFESQPEDTGRRENWLPCLEHAAVDFTARLTETPDTWLQRRIEMIDTPGATLAGWRLLMMMLEHEVHHRSQIDTYAGLNGWPVPQIFGRTAESIAGQRDDQLRRQRLRTEE